MNKRAFELSINFIVTLILAMVILSFGIYFVKMIYEESTEMKLTLDQQTEMELERLMDSGEKVSLYPGRRTVGSGEIARFGLGILNINDAETEFKVIINPSIATKNDGTEICKGNSCSYLKDWIKTTYDNNEIDLTIGNNEKKKILFGILPENAEPGTYVFDVKVNDGSYGGLKKVYVKVS